MAQRRSSHALALARTMRTGAQEASDRDVVVHDTNRAGTLVVAAAEGALAYALLAPKWFVRSHPVWGGIFAVLSVINIADAVG